MALITLILETPDETKVADFEHRVARAGRDAAAAVAASIGVVVSVKSATVSHFPRPEPVSARHADEHSDGNPRDDNSRDADAEANADVDTDEQETAEPVDPSTIEPTANPADAGPTTAQEPIKDRTATEEVAAAARDARVEHVGPEAEQRVADAERWGGFNPFAQ